MACDDLHVIRDSAEFSKFVIPQQVLSGPPTGLSRRCVLMENCMYQTVATVAFKSLIRRGGLSSALFWSGITISINLEGFLLVRMGYCI